MTDEVPPITPLRPPKPFGPAQMSAWFHKLASHLGKDLAIEPTGFLLVLLNDEQIKCWSAGTPEIRDEAALAAKDYRDHQQHPTSWDAPEVVRKRRRARKREHEEQYPFVCEVCTRRMSSQRDYDRHQATGHYCTTCGYTARTVADWWAHPCVTSAPAEPPILRLITREEQKGDANG